VPGIGRQAITPWVHHVRRALQAGLPIRGGKRELSPDALARVQEQAKVAEAQLVQSLLLPVQDAIASFTHLIISPMGPCTSCPLVLCA
jgi:hypothetical protein